MTIHKLKLTIHVLVSVKALLSLSAICQSI